MTTHDVGEKTRTFLDIGTALYKPFPVDRVGLLPKDAGPPYGNPQGQWQCKAFFFASVWDYVSRLDAIAPFEWSVTEHLRLQMGKRIVVVLKLTIRSVSMFGVGVETVSDVSKATVDPNDERSAWSSAFRRAAAYFGLGLPFYFLSTPKVRCSQPTEREKVVRILDDPLQVVSQTYDRHEALLASMPNEPALSAPSDIKEALTEPFPVGIIKWLAHTPSGDTCMAFPYITIWDYIRRINSICYGQWQMEDARVDISANKVTVKVRVSVLGNVQECLGEKLLEKSSRQGKVREIETAVENAWAEAMKGVLNYHGLGLYLRFVDAQQVAWNAQYKRVEKPRVEAIKLYHRYNISLIGVSEKEIQRVIGSSNVVAGQAGASSGQGTADRIQPAHNGTSVKQGETREDGTSLSSSPNATEDSLINSLQVQWINSHYVKGQSSRLQQVLRIYKVEKLEEMSNSQFVDLRRRIEQLASRPKSDNTAKGGKS